MDTKTKKMRNREHRFTISNNERPQHEQEKLLLNKTHWQMLLDKLTTTNYYPRPVNDKYVSNSVSKVQLRGVGLQCDMLVITWSSLMTWGPISP